MIISIEGCIGVGKTSLTKKLSAALGGEGIYEEFENNPFLKDFYGNPDQFGFHVQSTFLFLQSKQFMKATELAIENNVFSDFHPVKSKIFSRIVIKNKTEHDIIQKIYDRLFSDLDSKTLIVYLQASPEIILERIKLRGDKFTSDISGEYIESLINNYESFFENYKNPMISIDTNDLDFEKNNNDWLVIKKIIEDKMAGIRNHQE